MPPLNNSVFLKLTHPVAGTSNNRPNVSNLNAGGPCQHSSSAPNCSYDNNHCHDHNNHNKAYVNPVHHHDHDIPIYSNQTMEMIHDAIILSELKSPTPDVHILFTHFDKKYFHNKLGACTTLRWSSKMTLCAGICYSQYQKLTITKTYTGKTPGDVVKKQEQISQRVCTISLSEKLLKFRPSIDTISTLIHEMIHAFLFIDSNVVDREGHGDNFKWWMNYINRVEANTGIHITIYHSFHDEVDYYRQHHWKCAKCSMLVKRAMNRAPNKYDDWFPDHEKKCGGTFIKVKEPEKKKEIDSKKNYAGIQKSRKFMESFLKKSISTSSSASASSSKSECTDTTKSTSTSQKPKLYLKRKGSVLDTKNISLSLPSVDSNPTKQRDTVLNNRHEKYSDLNDIILIDDESSTRNISTTTIEVIDSSDDDLDNSISEIVIDNNDDDYIPPENVVIVNNNDSIISDGSNGDDVIIL
ncbi:hypothetical protein C9374_008835 [Naegleria lovaniensis]|uniref:SprT-like domain-containing protein n=1 Tax=Naegleria lovaniensis TaxID=51637 RepID=A0AA88GE32_NAELO|nr:uncharacterized protein C9374_013036 [Naegleria lovaniensis]XP_044545012.1 uncharacterized protein C9374_008835 [Naegleria lovaniensis]KAG2372914.1 hypothetical protein C9374_013036 [Naegleria lovaniensis]KAG2377750.1 hypothetical protein C9374_008835 [Naegleria lovaniensis]